MPIALGLVSFFTAVSSAPVKVDGKRLKIQTLTFGPSTPAFTLCVGVPWVVRENVTSFQAGTVEQLSSSSDDEHDLNAHRRFALKLSQRVACWIVGGHVCYLVGGTQMCRRLLIVLEEPCLFVCREWM